MATSAAQTVDAYLADLPEDRRAAISAVRQTILRNLPTGYQEVMQYGMVSYVIPLSRYPNTYNRQPLALASLGSQKNYMSVHLMPVYWDPQSEAWFTQRYKESGKRLDMGKACVRFRTLDDLPLDLIGEVVARTPVDEYLKHYEEVKGKAKAR